MLLTAIHLYFLGIALFLIQNIIHKNVEKRLKKDRTLNTLFLLLFSRMYDLTQKRFQEKELKFLKKILSNF